MTFTFKCSSCGAEDSNLNTTPEEDERRTVALATAPNPYLDYCTDCILDESKKKTVVVRNNYSIL